MTATEYVILVDQENREIGQAEKLLAHQDNQLHRAFSIFIFQRDEIPRLLLQQRALHKYHSPGLWTNTCCSHPRPGESILAAGKRRLQEELGFTTSLKDLGWFHYNVLFDSGLAENEIDHVLVGEISAGVTIKPHADEVQDFRFVTLDELQQELAEHPERFTFWLKQALEIAVREIVI